MSTHAEHMAWCKQRALAYIDRGDLVSALASMASDVRKHPETDTPMVATMLAQMGVRCVSTGDAAILRRLIEGFAE